GHSQGEIAAAHVAGALSLDDAARIVAVRSRLGATLVGTTGIMSVALGAAELHDRLARWAGGLAIAAANGAEAAGGPAAARAAGEASAVVELAAELEREGVRARRMPAVYGSHTRYVEPLREELLAELAAIRPRRADVPFCSSVTGGVIDGSELDAAYWYGNLR